MKLTHKQKVKMARKMRSQFEMSHKSFIMDEEGKPVAAGYRNIFDTAAWMQRKLSIAARVKNQIERARARKAERMKLKVA